MLNRFKKISNKKALIFTVLLIVTITFVLVAPSAQAKGIGGMLAGWAATIVGGLARAAVSALGWILAKLMGVLIYVARYNDFTNATAINVGWVVARDLANMFFIVILLVIAFATILQQEKYNYKQWLPKLILMAILINFSKTICGLLIDISQVVMLTFVNAFSEIGAGSLTDMLGIADWQSLKSDTGNTGWELTAAYVLAVAYAVIALATVAAMVAMLVMRIVMIWVYVVLSPFAYLLASFPGGASYSSQWWSEFTKNLIIGPVLAFFIWLSFAALGSPNESPEMGLSGYEDAKTEDFHKQGGTDVLAQQTTSDLMIQFIVSIAMLIGGMKIAQSIGGAAGTAAGKTMGKLKGAGGVLAGAAGGYALAGAKWTGRRAGAGAKTALTAADKKLGHGLDVWTGTQRYGDKGLVSRNVQGVKTFANRKIALLKGERRGTPETQELDSLNRDYTEARKLDKGKKDKDKARMPYRGKEYRRVMKGKNRGKMVEVDADGKFTDNVLRGPDGQEVKGMSSGRAARYDAVRQSFRSLNTEVHQKEEKKVTESREKFAEMNLNTGEINRKLASAGTTAVDKMALAMIKASKGAFDSKEEVETSRAYLAGNPKLSSKFNDEIDAKRPDLNYDFNDENDSRTFKKRLSVGKVDLSKIGDKAKGDPGLLGAVREQKGANFPAWLQKMGAESSAEGRTQLASGTIALKMKEYANPDRTPAENRDEAMKVAKLHANTFGDWGESFKDQSNNLDDAALGEYIKSARGKNLNNMAANDYVTNNNIKTVVRANITAGQLTSMIADGSNPELPRAIIADVLANANANPALHDAIQANPTLLTF